MTPTPYDPTSLAAAQQNTRESTKVMVDRTNDALKRVYLQNFEAWAVEVRAGKRSNQSPPTPPNMWTTFTDSKGFDWPTIPAVYTPVCSVPPIPEDNTAPKPHEVGEANRVNVPANDSTPTGTIIDGIDLLRMGASPFEVGSPTSRWQKMSQGGPWGVWRWYERVPLEKLGALAL